MLTGNCRHTIIFKLIGGDYYHVPVSQVEQICPELEATADDAVEDGTVSCLQSGLELSTGTAI